MKNKKDGKFCIDKLFSLIDKQSGGKKKSKASKETIKECKKKNKTKKRKYVAVDDFTGKRLYAVKKPITVEVNL